MAVRPYLLRTAVAAVLARDPAIEVVLCPRDADPATAGGASGADAVLTTPRAPGGPTTPSRDVPEVVRLEGITRAVPERLAVRVRADLVACAPSTRVIV